MRDAALQRKMAQEFSGIEKTTFWSEYTKELSGHKDYHSQTLKKSEKEWELARAQGSVFAIDRICRLPSDLTGLDKALEDKETN